MNSKFISTKVKRLSMMKMEILFKNRLKFLLMRENMKKRLVVYFFNMMLKKLE
jgi:hypothetical protein